MVIAIQAFVCPAGQNLNLSSDPEYSKKYSHRDLCFMCPAICSGKVNKSFKDQFVPHLQIYGQVDTGVPGYVAVDVSH